MAENRNQHFVPQYYFKGFSSNKKNINLLERKSGKIIRNTSIKSQCSKKYFYGSNEEEDREITKHESEHNRLLKNLNSIKSLTEYNNFMKSDDVVNMNIFTISELIIFQRIRTIMP